MNEAKRIRSVSFRLTDEEYGEIEKAAGAAGDEPNNWCRQLVLTAAREGPLFGEDWALNLHGARRFAVFDRQWTKDLVWSQRR